MRRRGESGSAAARISTGGSLQDVAGDGKHHRPGRERPRDGNSSAARSREGKQQSSDRAPFTISLP